MTSTMSAATAEATNLSLRDALRAAVRGPVLTGADKGYAGEVSGFDLAQVHAPAVVVGASGVDDVVATVRIASDAGLPITIVGSGHGDIPLVTAGIMLNVRRINRVRLDQAARTATIGVGATWHDVLDVTTPAGLAPLCGSAPAVGIGGYLLGGGLGPIGRTFGFASDRVRSFEIVCADGVVRVVSAHCEPDLFWALRGGKGGFGVVTAVTIELLELASIYGGGEYYAAADIAGLLTGYQRMVDAGVPDSLTASVAILRLPDRPVIPTLLRGKTLGHLRIGYVGCGRNDRDEVEALLNPIRQATGHPILGALHTMPYAQIGSIHADPTVPSAHASAGVLLDQFDPETVGAILGIAGPGVDTPLAIVEVRQYGGALSRSTVPPDAVTGRSAGFGMWVSGAPMAAGDDDALLAARVAVRGVLDAVTPWSTERVQINFCGSVNTADEAAAAWSGDIAQRLAAIRLRYDPDTLFAFVPGAAVR